MRVFLFSLSLFCTISIVLGHGYMAKPVNRNGRMSGLSGGGTNFAFEKGVNGTGGLCGDRIGSDDHPHYGNGAMALKSLKSYKSQNCYKKGGVIEIDTVITANHKGFMRWYLCPLADPSAGNDASAECLRANRLELADGSGTDVIVTPNKNRYVNTFQLPDIECERCVLQWWWRCGNNWGGQGVAQEQFWNCADIMISPDGTCNEDTPVVPTPVTPVGPTTPTSAPAPTPASEACWEVSSWWPRGCAEASCDKAWGIYKTQQCCVDDDMECSSAPTPVTPPVTPPAPVTPVTPVTPAKSLVCKSAKACIPDAYCAAAASADGDCSELSMDHGLCKEVEMEEAPAPEEEAPAPEEEEAPAPAGESYEAADCADFKKHCAPTCTTAEHGWGPNRAQCYGSPPQYWCRCNDGFEPALTVRGGTSAKPAADELLQIVE